MLIREVGGASIWQALPRFDDRRRELCVEIWWADGVSEGEKGLLLERCTEELRKWKGLAGYEARVVSASRPFRFEPPLGSEAYARNHRRRDVSPRSDGASPRSDGAGPRSKGRGRR